MNLARPRPPEDFISIDGLMSFRHFIAAPDVGEWIATAYLDDAGPLYNPDHDHLDCATIGVLWAKVEASRHGRRILGQAEMPVASASQWADARRQQQLAEWFGDPPDFLLTLDAVFAAECDDATFCALVDHELYHCGQGLDEFGMPKFRKNSGEPVYAIRGHDVEEFVGVVRRFGIGAVGQSAVDLVIAAADRPEIGPAKLAQGCGTCLRSAA